MPNPKAVRNFTSTLRAGGFLTRSAGRKIGMMVINSTGSSIGADKLVAISGFDVTTKLPKIVLADADAADLATEVFVTFDAIATGKTGNVYKGGLSAANLNTNSVSTVGDPVYLSTTAGAFTVTAPTADSARTVLVGYTTVKSATVGQIMWDIHDATRFSNLDVNLNVTDTKVLVASATATSNVTQATLTGFAWTVAAGGTYVFDTELATTMSTNGGLKLTFLLTTATLTSIRYNTYQSTATDNGTAVSDTGTTATSGTAVMDNKTAAYTRVKVYGSMVVNAGGTFTWQFAQNTSHSDTTTILLGSYASMRRVL